MAEPVQEAKHTAKFQDQETEVKIRSGVCPGCCRAVATAEHPELKTFVAYCICGRTVKLET